MYCIVEFPGPEGRKEVAVIHRNWICGDKCYWPPFWRNSSLLKQALKNGERPDPTTWSLYDGRVVGNRMFETFDSARKKLKASMESSELSSDEQLGQRSRKRTHPQQELSSAESEIEDASLFVTPKTGQRQPKISKRMTLPPSLPTPPLPPPQVSSPASHSLVAVANLVDFERNKTGPGMPTSTAVYNPPTAPFASSSYKMFSDVSDVLHNVSESAIGISAPSPDHQFDFNGRGPGFGAANNMDGNFGTFQSYQLPAFTSVNDDRISSIQNSMALLTAKVDMGLDMLRTLLEGRPQSSRHKPPESLTLPMTTVADFNRLHEAIKTGSETRSGLVTMMSVKGGNTPNQVTHRIVGSLMTDELMKQFSFAGHTGKISFKDSLFMTCICEAVRSTEKGRTASDKDVEKAVEYWLKKATTRINKRNNRQDGDGHEENDRDQ